MALENRISFFSRLFKRKRFVKKYRLRTVRYKEGWENKEGFFHQFITVRMDDGDNVYGLIESKKGIIGLYHISNFYFVIN